MRHSKLDIDVHEVKKEDGGLTRRAGPGFATGVQRVVRAAELAHVAADKRQLPEHFIKVAEASAIGNISADLVRDSFSK